MPKCKVCREPFKKLSVDHKVCKPECAITWNKQEKERKAAKETREKKVVLRSRRDWLKLAQAAFNAFKRKEDEGKPCISCGVILVKDSNGGGFDCGHYRSIGSAPHLRFHPHNAHGQCKKCNRYGSGMAVDYRIRLIRKIGIEAVEALEADQSVKKWTIPELIEIQTHYKAKLKELSKCGSIQSLSS